MIARIIILLIFLFYIVPRAEIIDQEENDAGNDWEILDNTEIKISKEGKKIVDAIAKTIFIKDDENIYLQGEYMKTLSKRKELVSFITSDLPRKDDIFDAANSLHSVNGNVRAYFYDEMNLLSSILFADSARINNRYNSMIAEGNVVIYSPHENVMLLGSIVQWNNKAKRIISEQRVKIIKINEDSECIQESIGFESDINLTNYIFYNIKGQIGEDCF